MKIVVFSDGTGNSSAKLFRTNVWRLYEALDLGDESEQVAYYDNGVGTAAFRPLALLGGAFGWGLKRNVLDIYTFICRQRGAARPAPDFGVRVQPRRLHDSRPPGADAPAGPRAVHRRRS